MSASVSEDGVDVNLTPLLDLVLQLIMFFMITLRLVQYEQSNEEIALPETQLSLPAEDEKKKNRFPVWVNLDYEGNIIGLGKEVLTVPIKRHIEDADYEKTRAVLRDKIESYFKEKKTDIDRQARVMKLNEGEWKVGVVIRADRRTRYEQVWTIMDVVQEANFDFWQLSVLNLEG